MVCIALHEAGHAVCDFVLGKNVVSVWIAACQGFGGYQGECTPMLGKRYRQPSKCESVRRSLLVSMAGREAQNMLMPTPPLDDEGHYGVVQPWDLQLAIKDAEWLVGLFNPDDVQPLIAAATAEARQIVTEHRAMVERIAISLIDQRLLFDACFAELNLE